MNGRGWLPWVLCIAAGASLAAWQAWRMRPVAAPAIIAPRPPAPLPSEPTPVPPRPASPSAAGWPPVGLVQPYEFHFNRRQGDDAVFGAAGRLVLRCYRGDAAGSLWGCEFQRLDRIAWLGPGAPADPAALQALAAELVGEVRLGLGPSAELQRLDHDSAAGSRRREIHEGWVQAWPRALSRADAGADWEIGRDGRGLPLRVRGRWSQGGAHMDVALTALPPEADATAPPPDEPDAAAIADLERALDDPDPLRRQPALQALGAAAGRSSSARLRDQLAERIEGLLAGGRHDPAEVLAALGKARAERSWPALLPYLEHHDSRLRLAAAQALAGYAALPASARERLRARAEGDDDPQVREAARRALGRE